MESTCFLDAMVDFHTRIIRPFPLRRRLPAFHERSTSCAPSLYKTLSKESLEQCGQGINEGEQQKHGLKQLSYSKNMDYSLTIE